jgi:hypothetical protein
LRLTDETSGKAEEFTDTAQDAAADQWTSLTCATCETVTRIAVSEFADADNVVSCKTCWQPLQLANDGNDSASGRHRQDDETRHDQDTVSDLEPTPQSFATQELAEAKRVRRRVRSKANGRTSVTAETQKSVSSESLEPAIEPIKIDTADDETPQEGWTSFKRSLERRRDDFAGAIISVVVHMLLWVILAAIVIKFNDPWGDNSFNLSMSNDASLLDGEVVDRAQHDNDLQTEAVVPMHAVRVDHLLAGGGGGAAGAESDFSMPSSDDMQVGVGDAQWSIELGKGFGGRSAKNRLERALAQGGTQASEDAVELGLKWLAQTQRDDGSWDFSSSSKIVLGRASSGSGKKEPMAATAMAVMCFLGAGYTHHDDKYREEVAKAMEFLKSKQKRTGDARGKGDMYSQGLVAIALCEGYGMTGDPTLHEPAQTALDFIKDAQHSAGGWRYQPRQAGDTSVVGWQVMAIASGRMAGLKTSRVMTGKAVGFLDSVCNTKTGGYGYVNPNAIYGASTPIGTLSRMYLHFGFDPNVMKKSIAASSKVDPIGKDLYARYYAMQVLHHVGGRVWKTWNAKCRDHILAGQTKTGTNKGSWAPTSKWATRGGARHYESCMSIMCLEVYYRHMRIYQDAAFE